MLTEVSNRQLALVPDLPYRWPVMHVGTAAGKLDLSCDQVLRLIERGAVWAWDVGSPRSKLRELRLLSHSVNAVSPARARELLADEMALCSPAPASLDDAIEIILEAATAGYPPRDHLSGPQIRRALAIGRSHLITLLEHGALTLVPGTSYRPGPGGHPLITRSSVELFLRDRITD